MKDYEIYNNYHRWIKQGDKVNKYAYERLQEHQSLEEILLNQLKNEISNITEN